MFAWNILELFSLDKANLGKYLGLLQSMANQVQYARICTLVRTGKLSSASILTSGCPWLRHGVGKNPGVWELSRVVGTLKPALPFYYDDDDR